MKYTDRQDGNRLCRHFSISRSTPRGLAMPYRLDLSGLYTCF